MTARRTRDYRHFPPEYDNALRAFARDGSLTFQFPEERDARHTARELYRYREALQAAADAEPENEHVRAMCEIFRDVIVRVFDARLSPPYVNSEAHLPSEARWQVRLELNPVVAAMRSVAVAGPPTEA
jgi:hypothetical protein